MASKIRSVTLLRVKPDNFDKFFIVKGQVHTPPPRVSCPSIDKLPMEDGMVPDSKSRLKVCRFGMLSLTLESKKLNADDPLRVSRVNIVKLANEFGIVPLIPAKFSSCNFDKLPMESGSVPVTPDMVNFVTCLSLSHVTCPHVQ